MASVTTDKGGSNELGKYENLQHGEHFIDDELKELGLQAHTNHIKVEFDNERSIRYGICKSFLTSLATIYFWIVWPFFYCCIAYAVRTSMESRKAAVTDKQIVYKWGYYGCFCCCWNEKIKTVPLDKITDLQIQQGCVQRCFDIKEIRVETASANQQEPEMSLVGIKQTDEIRSMVLQMRDDIQSNGAANINNKAMSSLIQNKSYGTDPQLIDINTKQQETLVEIRDLLVDVRKELREQKA